MLLTLCLLLGVLSLTHGQQFNVSSDGGCLRCGGQCLDSVQEALPGCLAPVLMAAGAAVGVPVPDFGLTGDVVSCIRSLVGGASECRECIESLVCCVTDSCKYCHSFNVTHIDDWKHFQLL